MIVPHWFYMDGGFYGDGYVYEVGENTLVIGNPNSNDPDSSYKLTNVKTVQINKDNYHQYKDEIDEAIRDATPAVTLEDFYLINQKFKQSLPML